DGIAFLDLVREVSGANAFPIAAMGMIAHRGDGEMNFTRMSKRTRGDGIETRWELPENAHKRLRCEPLRSKRLNRIHNLATIVPVLQLFLGILSKKSLELGGTG